MSDQQFHQAIDAMREAEIDPDSVDRVAERIRHDALIRRRPWRVLSLAGAVLLAFVFWPRVEERPSEPSAITPPPQDEPEEIEETPIEPEEKKEPKPVVDGDQILEVDELTVRIWPTKNLVDPARTAVAKLGKELAQPLKKLRLLGGGSIVVRIGGFDSVEKVLQLYKLPHTVTARLDEPTLAKARLVFLNCARKSKADTKPLSNWIRAGGWVAASDWGVHILEAAAPKTLAARPVKRLQPDSVVKVKPAVISPLLTRVFDKKAPSKWWIEEASQFVQIESKQAITLVSAPAFKKGFGSSELMVWCPYGKGALLYTQAHFDQKERGRETPDVAAMHRFILNLLIERFVRK